MSVAEFLPGVPAGARSLPPITALLRGEAPAHRTERELSSLAPLVSHPRTTLPEYTRARREKARLQGSCEVLRDWASRGDVKTRQTSRARHIVP